MFAAFPQKLFTIPFPDFHTLGHIWFSLHGGFVLPNEEKPGEHR